MEKLCSMGHDILLNGSESWPILGEVINKKDLRWAINLFAERKFKRYWNCLEKAIIIADFFDLKYVTLGRLKVYSKNFGSSYGFEFNPPLEFHAWVNYGDNIIDLALPGVIEMGCILKDKYGPYLDRKPIVLAGEEIPNWIEYTAIRKYNWMEYVTMNNRRIYETQI